MLKLLDQSLHTSNPDHDPLLESSGLWNDISESKHLLIASEAITTVYSHRISENSSPYLHNNDITCLESLRVF